MSVHRIMDTTSNRHLPQPSAAAPNIGLGGPSQQHTTFQQTTSNGRVYSLDIVQQPSRARMCGFGDKDRRPITPPPCIRLRVTDAKTGRPLDVNEIETQFFVLTVDLWSADGQQEANLVRHSSTSPSISAATATSYPPEPSNFGHAPMGGPVMNQQYYMGYDPAQQNMANAQYANQQRADLQNLQHYMQRQQTANREDAMRIQHEQQQLQNQGHHHSIPKPGQTLSVPATSTAYMANLTATGGPVPGPGMSYQPQALMGSHMSMNMVDPRASGMYTRNLIGNLAVGAFKLMYPDNDLGIWFILQDLSVRTEGHFRLKLSFVDVGEQLPPSSPNANKGAPGPAKLNLGSAPVLASAFSTDFQVFSAKKFPGVVDSTDLSKAFAKQGIKIPIRKDGVRGTGSPDDAEEVQHHWARLQSVSTTSSKRRRIEEITREETPPSPLSGKGKGDSAKDLHALADAALGDGSPEHVPGDSGAT